MDELNNEFEKLFESNEGWIVTKNLAHTTKLANAKDVNTRDDEVEGNWLTIKNERVPKTKPKYNYVPYQIYNKLPQLFLRDIIRSEQKENYFIFNGLSFIKVLLCGTITSVYEHKAKTCLVVDDGTGNIVCFVNDTFVDNAAKQSKKCQEELQSLLSTPECSKALLITNQAIRYELKQIPTVFDESLLGKLIFLHGKVNEYNGRKYIFMDKFQLVPEEDNKLNRYLEDTLKKYENDYFNKNDVRS